LFSIKLHLVRVDGSQDHAIAPNLAGSIRHPDFSPDGSRLAFDQLAPEEPAYVYVARGDGSNAKRLSLEAQFPGAASIGNPPGRPTALGLRSLPMRDRLANSAPHASVWQSSTWTQKK
jgi:hypothetical protein